MVKLQQLTAFLVGLNLVAAEQLDGWVENPQILPRGKSMGDGGMVLYTQTYDAVISIERFPHKNHPAELLFGQVCAWLIEHGDGTDEIPKPRTDVDVLDDQTADIEMTISFEEDVMAVADPAGSIVLGGARYRLADVVIGYAETGEVAS